MCGGGDLSVAKIRGFLSVSQDNYIEADSGRPRQPFEASGRHFLLRARPIPCSLPPPRALLAGVQSYFVDWAEFSVPNPREKDKKRSLKPPAMRASVRAALCVVAACLLPLSGLAASTNATIDDNYGDSVTGSKPTYSNDWNYGPDCPGCYIQPDKTKAYEQSWHDATASPDDSSARNVSFSFNGMYIAASRHENRLD